MSTRRTAGLPGRLENVWRRFERWRRSRTRGRRIPEALWAAAVEAAREYGASRTASVLRINYETLKRRLQQQRSETGEVAKLGELPGFIELALPARGMVGECILELEDVDGAKMRVHLKGLEAPDLAALAHSFRRAEP